MGQDNKIKKFFKRYYQIMLLVFVMLFSVMAVAGNVLRNEKLIDNTKKDSSSSTVTDTMKDIICALFGGILFIVAYLYKRPIISKK